ncbi:transposable element Tcb1 transposase [Trichonephila clavipes]|nr:transposable element Tcb1 transposase [Trichonephila clavipes]
MVVNDRTASSRQLAASLSTATGVLMLTSSIRRHLPHGGLRTRVLLYRIHLAANHRRLRLQWAHEHRAWQAAWPQVVFSDELRFNLGDHDGRIRVRHYVGERCFPECVIERYSAITPGIMVVQRLARDQRPAASKDGTFSAHTNNMEFSTTSRHSKSV